MIGTITTDAKGIANLLLEDLKADHDFIVVQTKGAEGYDLALSMIPEIINQKKSMA